MLPLPCAPGVLVIDDDPAVLGMLNAALSWRGFRVWTSASGEEGVDCYREHQRDIDLVLLDVCMPGLDGPATVRLLRDVNPDVRAYLMSGYAGGYSSADLQELGIDGFFAKPFQLLDVTEALWEAAASARVG